MPIYRFEERVPQIAADAWVAQTAVIIGDVRIADGVYVGHGAILRGDYGTIHVGAGSAIEEGVIVHARPGDATRIGREVTVGHGAMIHNATIEDMAVIGMRATVSDYAVVGRWAFVGEAALVRSHQTIEAERIAVGVPAQDKGPVEDKHRQLWSFAKQLYQGLAERYPAGQVEIAREEALPREE